MRLLKVFAAMIIIGCLELVIIKDKSKDEKEAKLDKRCFEIAMSILMSAWILRDGL